MPSSCRRPDICSENADRDDIFHLFRHFDCLCFRFLPFMSKTVRLLVSISFFTAVSFKLTRNCALRTSDSFRDLALRHFLFSFNLDIIPLGKAQVLITHLYNLWKWFRDCFQNTPESCFFQDVSGYQPLAEDMHLLYEFRFHPFVRNII
jgi:hypothetical protein